MRATAPRGTDVALDVVAGGLVSEGLQLLREGGRWVIAVGDGRTAGWRAHGARLQLRGRRPARAGRDDGRSTHRPAGGPVPQLLHLHLPGEQALHGVSP